MAKISTKLKIERHFNRQVWAVLRAQFTDCRNVEDAVQKLTELTKGKIEVKPLTIFKMIEQGIQDGEVKEKDFYYKWGIKSEGGHRGKVSMRYRIEKYVGKNLWDWFREHFADITTKKEACERISQMTGGAILVGEQTIVSTIEKGLELKEIKPEDPFVCWADKKRRRKKTEVSSDTPQIEEKTYIFTGECKNCGQGERASITRQDFYNLGGIGVTGKRCSKCGCWASFIFKGNIDGKDIVDEKKYWKLSNPSKFKKEEA